MRWVCARDFFSPRIRMTLASMRQGMRMGQSPLQRLRLRLCCFGKNEVCAQVCAEPEATWAAWGSLPLKLGMRRVCASHIPRWSSGSSWSSRMRWVCVKYARIASLSSRRSHKYVYSIQIEPERLFAWGCAPVCVHCAPKILYLHFIGYCI